MSEDLLAYPCASFCETTHPMSGAGDLAEILARTCWEAGFPSCGRMYVGSYFCENYFCALPDSFHEAVRDMCERHGMSATLVVPIAGQSFLERVERRVIELLDRFSDAYDEVVLNDVAAFMWLSSRTDRRLGLGRLFSKGLRDARYPEAFGATSRLELSPEAQACLQARPDTRPLVEVDPLAAVIDVSALAGAGAEIAVHLPFCYATTGRNCSLASIGEPDSEKFRFGRDCGLECLRMLMESRTEQGVRYLKHGRTHFYDNPSCQIAGAPSDGWRIIYAQSDRTRPNRPKGTVPSEFC